MINHILNSREENFRTLGNKNTKTCTSMPIACNKYCLKKHIKSFNKFFPAIFFPTICNIN